MEDLKLKTNDEARKAFADSGLEYSDIGIFEIFQLCLFIEQAIYDETENMTVPSMRVDFRDVKFRGADSDTRDAMAEAYITVSSNYFEGREAVSFNNDGFIGFAGWADSKNVRPILRGFAGWLECVRRAMRK